MKTVFDLGDGQVAAVLNHDHTLAYVVRVVEHQYNPEKLRELYLAEAYDWLGQSLMNNERAQAANAAVAGAMLEKFGYQEERLLAPRADNEE